MLADHETGRKALADRELLKDVVKYKKAFYRVGYADYDACLHGKTRLVSPEGKLADLERDFNEMKPKSMFEGTPPSFTQMMNRLNDLAQVINETQRTATNPVVCPKAIRVTWRTAALANSPNLLDR